MLSWAGKPLPRKVFNGSYSKDVEFGSGVSQGRTECRSPCAHRTTAPGEGSWMAADAVRSGVRGILGGVRAPARLEAQVQRQAQLASKLDPAVNQALAVSTPQPAGSGLSLP